MGNIQFHNNKVLFANNKVAMHADCCCDISGCQGCSGDAPEEFSASISGVGDGDCDPGDCDAANGTFVVSYISGPGATCLWRYTPSGLTICGVSDCYLELTIVLIGGVYYCSLIWRSSSTLVVGWEKKPGSAFDCMNLSGYSLDPAATVPKKCEETGSTATLTAL